MASHLQIRGANACLPTGGDKSQHCVPGTQYLAGSRLLAGTECRSPSSLSIDSFLFSRCHTDTCSAQTSGLLCFPLLNYHSLIQSITGKLRPKSIEHFVPSHIAGKPADKTSFNLGSLALVARITTAMVQSLPLCARNHGISHTVKCVVAAMMGGRQRKCSALRNSLQSVGSIPTGILAKEQTEANLSTGITAICVLKRNMHPQSLIDTES